MSATLRYRGERSNLVELAKNWDAFKKVPEQYTETTQIGGTLSLLSRVLIIYLIYKELCFYHDAKLKYQFEPDIDMDQKVEMNVDITVAMPCKSISNVDFMDETQQDPFTYSTLQHQGTWWTMTEEDRIQFDRTKHMNLFLREEYHSVADILFKDIIYSNEVHFDNITNENPILEEQFDACRVHGTLGINKVAGELRLVGGAQPVFNLFDDHVFINFVPVELNVSHRINRLSFGQYSRRIVQPLEGDETFISEKDTTVQYFLKIVPTEIHNIFSTINTYQYSVTENIRKLDADHNSYGSPGIYIKYDWSALKIIVRTDRDNPVQFIIRISSIISGIVVISGLLNAILIWIHTKLISTLAPQLLKEKQNKDFVSQKSPPLVGVSVKSAPAPTAVPNNLLRLANSMDEMIYKPSVPRPVVVATVVQPITLPETCES